VRATKGVDLLKSGGDSQDASAGRFVLDLTPGGEHDTAATRETRNIARRKKKRPSWGVFRGLQYVSNQTYEVGSQGADAAVGATRTLAQLLYGRPMSPQSAVREHIVAARRSRAAERTTTEYCMVSHVRGIGIDPIVSQ